MTLGRTPTGAIKIKTDGGLRTVGCACCGGCGCGSALPINPPSDPDFTKKLRGDAGVSAFTQVSINYSISVSGTGRSASGTMNGAWGEALVNDPEGAYPCADYVNGEWVEVIKAFAGSNCTSPPSYDACGGCLQYDLSAPNASRGYPEMFLKLRANGCLVALLIETFDGGYFHISDEVCAPKRAVSSGISVTINGVSTYVISQPPEDYFGVGTVTGFFNITFS
jgi:hypothetical protein